MLRQNENRLRAMIDAEPKCIKLIAKDGTLVEINAYGLAMMEVESADVLIGKPIDAIEKSMDNVGILEMYKMEKNLSIISIIARIAPLFGFLGTIIGMLQLFKGIAASAEYTPNTIADGIYIKMITSATGLIIGILAYIGYSYLVAQINRVENKMEIASADFVDILQEPTR